MAIIPSIGKPDAPVERAILSPASAPQEAPLEQSLRPRTLAEYTGQAALKDSLQIAIDAAKGRGEPLDHLLFYGPPGLGKTSLSLIIAQEMGVSIRITSAPALERPRDIAGLLVSLKPGDILFIDEIHRLSRLAEEILYPAMEDFSLDITIGKGQSSRIKRLALKRFTLIGATTRAGALSSPLRDRFGLIQRLDFYRPDELARILERAASLLKIDLTAGGGRAIAQRSRGTPRIANRLLKRVRDFAQVKSNGQVTEEVANQALDQLRIDPLGLDPTDRHLLDLIIRHFGGGPVGIETLATAISEDVSTIEDVYEPYLLQSGLLCRTPRGRTVTELAYRHLGHPLPGGAMPLFDGDRP
jgi:Holliday junction DNA helicase RuvB